MTCVALAEPALRQLLDAYRAHARILGSEPPQDVAGRVGGSIVDDDHLECDMPLREQMTNRRVEACVLIARRHDHRASHRAARQSVCRCGKRLERRQPPRPPLMVERGHRQADEDGGVLMNAMVIHMRTDGPSSRYFGDVCRTISQPTMNITTPT